MKSHHLKYLLLFTSLIFSIAVIAPPPVEGAPSRDKRKLAKLKKETRKLKRTLRSIASQLAEARRPVPIPKPFMEMVTVGNPGNPDDPSDGDGSTVDVENFGHVPYVFQIGKYEVTLQQYTAFLNAVAATDTYDLYRTNIGTHPHVAGIARSGGSGNYTYSVIGSGKHPVTNVTWFDAARFCNWLHNGRPNGAQDETTTEDGAYTLLGAQTGTPERNWGARCWIPSENEWYKAAYFHPHNEGGPADSYWLYPTGSDDVPGNLIGNLPNQANHRTPDNLYAATRRTATEDTNYLLDAGIFEGTAGFFGTFDMGGSVFEWNDAVIVDMDGTKRGLRGGSWFSHEGRLRSSKRDAGLLDREGNVIGFRIAGPELNCLHELPDLD
ncbi:MAG: PEP-CTERM sorting domain-containing protein [Verrucomicrobiales bacterium]|nr:PEP-CTERM sorting domain-containing protein [Verrucomicrobiales bacterium]